MKIPILLAFALLLQTALAQTPVTQAEAKTWMIAHFNVPPQAVISYFFTSGDPVEAASISWKIGTGPNQEIHTRSYDFRTQKVTMQIDL